MTSPWTGMYFTRYDDGSIAVHNPEEAPTWALELLESDDLDNGLTWENGVVTFTGRNGVHQWREVGRDDLGYGHVVVRTVRIDPEPASSETPHAKGP